MANDTGLTAIITGATGGLGGPVTTVFLDAGWTVVGVSRSIPAGRSETQRLIGIPAELTSLDEARKLVERTRELGVKRIDAVIHLVGTWAGGKPVAESDDATLQRLLDTNLLSAFHVARAVLPSLREQGAGSLVFVGSRAAVEATPGSGLYSASKAALLALTQAIAAENTDRSIRANIVLPDTIDTAVNRAAMPSVNPATWVKPERIAKLILDLSLPGSAKNGQAIPIYAGDAAQA